MAARRTRSSEAQLAFEAIAIEGGLLSPESLAEVAQLQADAQTPDDYRIPKGLNLRDEIGRYWRIAQAHRAEFERGRARGKDLRAVAERWVRALLQDVLGFATLQDAQPIVHGDRSYPVGHTALEGRVPVVIARAGLGLDTPDPVFGDVGRRRSAFGLAQEALNSEDAALWGIACDGLTLRVLRDNASLTRPAWIEVDLARIFAEERYADFAVLWLLAHETRFGVTGQDAKDCPLERWRAAGREKGTRAREFLRDGVEAALRALGQGFLSHPANGPLRDALRDGSLTPAGFFQELLRLVYRLIFLLTAEERELLHEPDAPADARGLYADGYGIRRLRERAVKRSAHDRFSDLWEGTKIVLRGVAKGEKRLALPALGGLFAGTECPTLDAAKLENRALLLAVFKLGWLKEEGGLSRVNWRDMGPEELGSVYEGLLELVPRIVDEGRTFGFADGVESAGNARKTTGSYYTPDGLVQTLLDGALEPVVADTLAANPTGSAEALLELTVVDPACGSGHFLLAAARRLAAHVARARANSTPSAAEYREAMRQVVGRCIFGVDLNPMAVELCRVSLWMEAVDPGRPLSFLDSHIQQGNSLLGTTPELMAKGIPDAAWDPIEGDDRKTASLLKTRNRKAADGQRPLNFSGPAEDEDAKLRAEVEALERAPDGTLLDVAGKAKRFEALRRSAAYRHQKLVADAWCAAFVWPKPEVKGSKVTPVVEAAPTNDVWRQVRDGQGAPSNVLMETTDRLAQDYSFFHWHLAFPQVFANGGFALVIGNPPWDQTEVKEREWFAAQAPEIAEIKVGAKRKAAIRELEKTNPALLKRFRDAVRSKEGLGAFLTGSGRYPLCGRGRVNLYAVFAELVRGLAGDFGRVGVVVPTGIATDANTQLFFGDIVNKGSLVSLWDFENGGLFAGVHASYKFCVLVLGCAGGRARKSFEFAFFLKQPADLLEDGRRIALNAEEIRRLSPNTGTCPIFRTRKDADLSLKIYAERPIFILDNPDQNPWSVVFRQGLFNATADSHLFLTFSEIGESTRRMGVNSEIGGRSNRYVAVLEQNLIGQYNNRLATFRDGAGEISSSRSRTSSDAELCEPSFDPVPRYWARAEEVAQAARSRGVEADWYLAYRSSARSTDSRTGIFCAIPAVGTTHSIFLVHLTRSETRRLGACLLANLNSLVLDYVLRQKIGGENVSFFIIKQLPVLSPEDFLAAPAWCGSQDLAQWVSSRVLELTYTSFGLEPFARTLDCEGPPFRWDRERRSLLMAELDAAFFKLYGLERAEVEHVLDSFPVVRRAEETSFGEFRTKRLVLESFDALARASRSRRSFQTRLDPLPADPRVAHRNRPGRA